MLARLSVALLTFKPYIMRSLGNNQGAVGRGGIYLLIAGIGLVRTQSFPTQSSS